ncbi:hypothetical protein N9Y42_10735 [Mariniblastus sp.]|nr:hypothetical protein [Mariniblastus sp.]
MLKLRHLLLLAVSAAILLASNISQHSCADVPKKHLKQLETVFLPAWNQGNNYLILKSLGRVVGNMSDEEIAEVDELLAQQQIPKSAQVLVQARLHLLRQGRERDLPRPGVGELVMTLENLGKEFENVIAEADALRKRVAKEGNEASFKEFEGHLWDNHVLQQKLQASITLAQYAAHMSKRNLKRLDRKLNEEQKELLKTDYAKVEKELSDTLKDVNEHEILVRMNRMKFANHLLGTESPLKDRYLATWSLQSDGQIVLETLSQEEFEFNSEVLSDPEVTEQIQEQIKTGSDLAGEKLIKKSGLLFTGLHWWMRGRYGMGSEAFGFMKSERAITSDAALFPLYMPEETPTPTSLSDDEVIPEIDRRHKYIWEWEYRRVSSSRNKSTSESGSSRVRVTQLTRFY